MIKAIYIMGLLITAGILAGRGWKHNVMVLMASLFWPLLWLFITIGGVVTAFNRIKEEK